MSDWLQDDRDTVDLVAVGFLALISPVWLPVGLVCYAAGWAVKQLGEGLCKLCR